MISRSISWISPESTSIEISDEINEEMDSSVKSVVYMTLKI